MARSVLAIAAIMPLALLFQGCAPALGQPVSLAGNPGEATFAELDRDSSTYLDRSEIPDLQPDIFEHVDRRFDDRLTAREYGNYQQLLSTIANDRAALPAGTNVYRDIAYVDSGHHRQTLDLYLPAAADPSQPLPLVIWIYGGGWQRGTKAQFTFQASLLNRGFAVAAINYRLTRHAPFPAQIHDSKAAVRFLRSQAGTYGLDTERFGVWGSSAGGHLASLVAAGSDVPELEGNLGTVGVSSKVQAAMVWHGPADMFEMFEFIRRDGPDVALSATALPKLFGGFPEGNEGLVRLGSPVNHITPDDPPFFMMHADGDPVVPLNQSVMLQERLRDSGVFADLHVVQRNTHGAFKGARELELVARFFEEQLK